jgi:hypothetical protein
MRTASRGWLGVDASARGVFRYIRFVTAEPIKLNLLRGGLKSPVFPNAGAPPNNLPPRHCSQPHPPVGLMLCLH